jgi:hypothetical protein
MLRRRRSPDFPLWRPVLSSFSASSLDLLLPLSGDQALLALRILFTGVV